MTSPEYGGTTPLKEGTDPGMVCSQKESKDTKHSKTAIVDFLDQTCCLCLFGPILVPAKWIVKVKSASWDYLGIEVREVTDFSSFHVMLVGNFVPVFQESNEKHDL